MSGTARVGRTLRELSRGFTRSLVRGFARPIAGVLVLVLVLPACPEGAPVATTCARVGDRCRMPDGPIGICGETLGECAEPPCLACQSQH